MNAPRVSVIIPSYNYADYVAEAIQSVLDQTFTDFEVIVVDDGSQDHTAQVVNAFTDPRVKYIYQDNKGLPGARNTGIKASTGSLLAYLDSDDKYHPAKLATQVAFLDANPQVGLAYNSRIIVDSAGNPLLLRRAPATVSLADLVVAYPFAPSDVVMRREWAEKVGLFDETFKLNSEDLNFHIRLQLAGCQFAGVQPALAYRKMHTGRIFRNIPGKMATYERALDTAFKDPRCPAPVLALQAEAHASHYTTWAYQALVQAETDTGQQFLLKASQLKPELLANEGERLLRFFIWSSLGDGGNHEAALRQLFAQLPPQLQHLAAKQEWSITQGYYLRGIRDILWGRLPAGQAHLRQASRQGIPLDEHIIGLVTDQLLEFEVEFGAEAVQSFLENLANCTQNTVSHPQIKHLRGTYLINKAFENYRNGDHTKVPAHVLRAVSDNPKYLANRGVLAMMVRSILSLLGKSNQAQPAATRPVNINRGD